ncbi:MAG: hypothetical protein Q9224_005415 [Gallowayella concinna]
MTDRVMGHPPDTYGYPILPNDWEDHRETIKRLYVTEDRALPEVVKEMKRLHNFVATERMYKRRISDWNLDKNVKDEEMRAIITREVTRSRQGKKSTFYVRGRLVDQKKIERFAQRKRIDRITLDGVSAFHKGIKCVTPPTDGPTVINIVSDEPTYGRSKRRPTHSCTPENKGSKRIRNLEENHDDQIAPPITRDPVEEECADLSGQLSSRNTNSSANGASTHRSLRRHEYTPMLPDPRTFSSPWKEEFGPPVPELNTTASTTKSRATRPGSHSTTADDSNTAKVSEIHKSNWQESRDKTRAWSPRQHPNSSPFPESSDGAVDQTSQSASGPITCAFPVPLNSSSRGNKSQHHTKGPWPQHYDSIRRASCEQRDHVETSSPWSLSDVAASKRALSTPSSDDSATSSGNSHRIMHQPSSQSSNSEPKPADITTEDGYEQQQHRNTSEQPQDTPSKLTINDMLKAAHSESPSGQHNIPKIDRTISDIYQDELYSPSKIMPIPPQSTLQNFAGGTLFF